MIKNACNLCAIRRFWDEDLQKLELPEAYSAYMLLLMKRDDYFYPCKKNPADGRRAVRTSVMDLLGESKDTCHRMDTVEGTYSRAGRQP